MAARGRSINDFYQLLRRIGSGVQGDVYLGVRLVDYRSDHHGILKANEQVAVKVVPRRSLRAALSETEVLKQVNHRNVISFYDYFEDKIDGYIYLVMDAGGGDVCDRIIKTRKPFSEQEASRMAADILHGLAHLHKRNILHLDLKPDNLLLSDNTEDAVVKLADFGWARIMRTQDGPINRLAGTISYAAPQVVAEREYGREADLWSIGVTLFVILSGRVLYGTNDTRRVKAIILDLLRPGAQANFPKFVGDVWKNVSEDAKDLICRCLTVDPKERITIEEALEHPWIKNINILPHRSLDSAMPDFEEFNRNRKLKLLESPVIGHLIYRVRELDFASISSAIIEDVSDPTVVQDMMDAQRVQQLYEGILSRDAVAVENAVSVLMNMAMNEIAAKVIFDTGGIRHLIHVLQQSPANPVAVRFTLIALSHMASNLQVATQIAIKEDGLSAIINLTHLISSLDDSTDGDGMKACGMLACCVLTALTLTSMQVRDVIVQAGGLNSLIEYARRSVDAGHRRQALTALAKLTETNYFRRLWSECFLPLLSSSRAGDRRDATLILADLAVGTAEMCLQMYNPDVWSTCKQLLETEADPECLANVLNFLGLLASAEDIRKAMHGNDVSGVISMFRRRVADEKLHDLGLDFASEWISHIYEPESPFLTLLMEHIKMGAMLHVLPAEAVFRNDAPMSQSLMYKGFSSSGKYHYEVELKNLEHLRCGFTRLDSDVFLTNMEVGDHHHSFAFEVERMRSVRGGARQFLVASGGRRAAAGDVIGCTLNMDDLTVEFFKNGEPVLGARKAPVFGGAVFDRTEYYSPCITFGRRQQAALNFGDKPFRFPPGPGVLPFCAVFLNHNGLHLSESGANLVEEQQDDGAAEVAHAFSEALSIAAARRSAGSHSSHSST